MDPTKITPEFLANLLEKSRAATKGPWITDEKEKPRSYDADYDTCNYDVVAVDPATDKITTTVSLDLGDDDAMFIAAANPASTAGLTSEIGPRIATKNSPLSARSK